MQKLHLPVPAPDAQASSQALSALIAAEIAQHAGWISFARFMELALYAPHFGYYTGGAAKLGGAGDFITAPEISAHFGAALANIARHVLPQTSSHIMEFGAGTGKLAVDLLTEMHRQACPPERYYIVELSGELRSRQEQALKDFPEVVWLDQMPASFSGMVLGNEVLDAMPVRLVKKTGSGWHEVGVTWEDGALTWSERALSDLDVLEQIPQAAQLPVGYLTEVHPVATGFMSSVAQMIANGAAGLVLWIDYGFPAAEYYLHQRDQGTLMCHYRHHAHAEPFYWPGLQDITAHVDFSAIARAGISAGLDLLCYTSQAGLLIHADIAQLLMRSSPSDPLTYLPQANALQKLLSPAEMGELFKALAMGVNVHLPEKLLQQNRNMRLGI
ncbi:SAM-dependent MidA family methyltransferase [Oxalobacteraceae bacterium GrIS 2.11]